MTTYITLARSQHTEHLAHPKYRADIDGLRAIAVLLVVGFHAFPFKVKGGFIGVDVFFVISGYLISTIIVGSLERNSFSFVEFYSRRIKRIFPALLLVLMACFSFAWFALLADEYQQLGKHIAGGAGFVSNFLFWNESGYFDNTAETKPLLHLWSLGIEEQFYIVWPLLMWFAWKRRLNLLAITIVVTAISFSLNLATVGSDASAAFYSPQTRFWELLVGSILAQVTLHRQRHCLDSWLSRLLGYVRAREENRKVLSNALSLCGAALIAISALVITKENQFPGWWAVLPTVGAMLVVSAGAQAWINRVVLSNRVLVWFGLISFPLYLWHWPLLSFANIVEGAVPSREIRIAAILISIVLAWLTYRLVEKPIRFGRASKAGLIALLALMIVVGFVGYNTYRENGYQSRKIAINTAEISRAKADWSYKTTKYEDGQITSLNKLQGQSKDSVLFIGDSLMGQYYPRANKIYSAIGAIPYYSTVFASRNHCLPVPYRDAVSGPENIKCNDYYLAAIKLAKLPIYKTIVLAGSWEAFFANTPELVEANLGKLAVDLNDLRKYGKDVVLISMSPHSSDFEPRKIAASLMNIYFPDYVHTNPNRWVERRSIEDLNSLERLRGLAAKVDAILMDPYDYLCPNDKCPVSVDDKPLYIDAYHMRATYAEQQAVFIDIIVNKKK